MEVRIYEHSSRVIWTLIHQEVGYSYQGLIGRILMDQRGIREREKREGRRRERLE